MTEAPRFRCDYDTHWPALLPANARHQLMGAREGFGLNPRWRCLSVAPPDWDARMAAIGYSPELPVCWVPHPLLGYDEAYWPTPGLLALIRELRAGRPIAGLSDDCFALLSLGHLLVLPEPAAQRETLFQHWRMRLATEGYLHLPNLIAPLQVAALRGYARQLQPATPADDPVLTFWQQQLAEVLCDLTDTSLQPLSSLIVRCAAAGPADAENEPGVWTLLLPLDSRPETPTPWPLYLQTRHGEQPMLLQPGDGLLYRGRELAHRRPPLEAGRHETLLRFSFGE